MPIDKNDNTVLCGDKISLSFTVEAIDADYTTLTLSTDQTIKVLKNGKFKINSRDCKLETLPRIAKFTMMGQLGPWTIVIPPDADEVRGVISNRSRRINKEMWECCGGDKELIPNKETVEVIKFNVNDT